MIQGPHVFGAGGDKVDPRGLDTAVAKNVGQAGHIPANLVEGPGEQVAEIVRENLPRLHAGLFADGLHLRPNLLARQRTTASGEKHLTGGDFLFSGVFEELPAELAGDEDGADFALQGDFRLARLCRCHGDIPHFTDPDARGADGLHEQGQALFSRFLCRSNQPFILLFCEFLVGLPEQAALEPQMLHPAVLPAHKGQESVQGRELPVDGSGVVILGQQLRFPGRSAGLCDLSAGEKRGKEPQLPEILFHGGAAPLLLPQKLPEGNNLFRCDASLFPYCPPLQDTPSVPCLRAVMQKIFRKTAARPGGRLLISQFSPSAYIRCPARVLRPFPARSRSRAGRCGR